MSSAIVKALAIAIYQNFFSFASLIRFNELVLQLYIRMRQAMTRERKQFPGAHPYSILSLSSCSSVGGVNGPLTGRGTHRFAIYFISIPDTEKFILPFACAREAMRLRKSNYAVAVDPGGRALARQSDSASTRKTGSRRREIARNARGDREVTRGETLLEWPSSLFSTGILGGRIVTHLIPLCKKKRNE